MGELYGGANEARFATDIMGVFRWMEGGEMPETVYRSNTTNSFIDHAD